VVKMAGTQMMWMATLTCKTYNRVSRVRGRRGVGRDPQLPVVCEQRVRPSIRCPCLAARCPGRLEEREADLVDMVLTLWKGELSR
jgi:hypothetical protein